MVELLSVPEHRKFNVVDMGTADKVSSAIFYMTMYESFVLVEFGSAFTAVVVVKDRKIIDGFGGHESSGLREPGLYRWGSGAAGRTSGEV